MPRTYDGDYDESDYGDDEYREGEYDAYDDDDDADEETDPEGNDPGAPCPYCGREMYDDAVQCPGCGRYVSEEDAPRKRKPWWILIGLAACFYAVWKWLGFLNAN